MTRTIAQDEKFCVVVPIYNESGNILPTIERVNDTLNISGLNADILCINDGSRDDTERELVEAQNQWTNVIVKAHESNMGFGAARWTGMKAARARGYSYIVFIDADLTMDPQYIIKFHEKMVDGFDFVTGSRFVYGGGMENVPWHRKAVSVVGNTILRRCFRLKINDYSQGFRAIRMGLIKQFCLTEKGFPVLVEELYQAKCLTSKFAEVPFVLTTREAGVSKFSYTPIVILKYLFYAGKALVAGF